MLHLEEKHPFGGTDHSFQMYKHTTGKALLGCLEWFLIANTYKLQFLAFKQKKSSLFPLRSKMNFGSSTAA